MIDQTKEKFRIGFLVPRLVLSRRFVVLGLALLLAGIVASEASGRSEVIEYEDVSLEGTYTDLQFLTGRSIRISANVTDDVFAAGRDVTFDSATVQNAVAAGYDVEQRGGTLADMIAAGANIKIAGTIKDDLVAAGRSIRISSTGTIGSDVLLAAETIDMEGRIEGRMRAAAARVTITGKISGKADILAERIVIGPGATIAGDLVYRSESEPEIAEGAKIGGEIRRVEMDIPVFKPSGSEILGIGLIISVSWTIAMLLLIVVIQLAFPGFMVSATDQLQGNFWASLGRGVAGLLLSSAFAALLCVSVLGLPLGSTMFLVMAFVLLLGYVTVSYCIGLLIRQRRHGTVDIQLSGRIGWAVAGAIILGIINLIPFLGGIVSSLAIAAGFGAATAEFWKRLRIA